jgi:hypothetical protein
MRTGAFSSLDFWIVFANPARHNANRRVFKSRFLDCLREPCPPQCEQARFQVSISGLSSRTLPATMRTRAFSSLDFWIVFARFGSKTRASVHDMNPLLASLYRLSGISVWTNETGLVGALLLLPGGGGRGSVGEVRVQVHVDVRVRALHLESHERAEAPGV